MEEKKLNSLVRLLDDPDVSIFELVKEQIIEAGVEVIPYLEYSWESTINNFLQTRIENIIQEIQFNDTLNGIKNWHNLGAFDLLEGAYLISKYQYPEIKFEDIKQQVSIIKKDIWLELNNNLTALEKINILNHVFFNIHKYKRITSNLHNPQNYYLSNILNTKKGNPISLGILYTAVAQSLELPIYAVDLPKNFIVMYKDSYDLENNEVLFYINPYNKGAVFGKKEILFFLKQQKLSTETKYFSSCTNLKTIQRLIDNLIESYQNLGYPNKIEDLKKIASILK